MLAVTFQAIGSVLAETVEDPCIEQPSDALVATRLAGICGSDLHVYHGRETGLDHGTVLGHELVGEVVEVGAEVRRFEPGDLVVSPFTTSCGQCRLCREGLTARCERGQLLGWRQGGNGLHGAQAELVRIPMADSTLCQIPAGLPLEAALLAGDVFSTGYYCALQAGVGPSTRVAVIGCGPVGLMAILAASRLGARQVVALDRVKERLRLARRFGADAIDIEAADPRSAVAELTDGLGVDAVLEAVGSPAASRLGLDLLRAGGTLSIVGVHTEPSFAFSPVEAYDRNLTLRIGRCPVRHLIERSFALLAELGEDAATIISHRLPLGEGPRGYRMFSERSEGCTKVVLEP